MPGLIQKFKEMWTPTEEYYEDEYEEREATSENNGQVPYTDKKTGGFLGGKVVSLRSPLKSKVVLMKPDHFGEDIKNVADELSKKHIIVLNLEDVAKPDSRRIIDFLSGATYAHSGNIKRIATDTFIITPCHVDIEGNELLNELENHGVYF